MFECACERKTERERQREIEREREREREREEQKLLSQGTCPTAIIEFISCIKAEFFLLNKIYSLAPRVSQLSSNVRERE